MSDDSPYRAEHDEEITENGPFLDIGDIQCLAFFLTQITSAGNLPWASNSWLDEHARGIQRGVPFIFLWQWWSWAHNRHIAFEHIQELRHLVNGVLSYEFPNRRDTWIVLHLEYEAPLLPGLFSQILFVLVCVHNH